MKSMDDARLELTLMLLYLNSWQERGLENRRAWKGYDFGVLDRLEDAGHIYGNHRAKSLMLDESGVQKARELLAEYGIA